LAYGVNANNVPAGTTVTFTWQAEGDTARLDRLNADGVTLESFPVPVSGQYSQVIAGSARLVIYRLVVIRGSQEATANIPISVICQIPFFFGDAIAPATAACPSEAARTGDGAYQGFERGLMIFVNVSSLNKIYGLSGDSLYAGFTNNWDGVTLREDPAPSGLVIPQQMFNWAYYNTLAPIGGWNSAIGWGIGGIDTGQRTIQYEGAFNGAGAFYIDAPGNAVYRFSGSNNGSWTRIR
jgi:hypothetical protein